MRVKPSDLPNDPPMEAPSIRARRSSVTTVDEQGGTVTTSSSPRHVHIVDATQGPLIGDGRLQRVMPFAITATLSMVVAVPATSWARPGLAIVGAVLIAATIAASLAFPWAEVARSAQLVPPFLFLISTLLLASAAGNGIGSPFITLAVLPLMWLAIYENRSRCSWPPRSRERRLWLSMPDDGVQSSNYGIVTDHSCSSCAGPAWASRCTGSLRTRANWPASCATISSRSRTPPRCSTPCPSASIGTVCRTSRSRYCNAAWAAQYNVDPDAGDRPPARGVPVRRRAGRSQLAARDPRARQPDPRRHRRTCGPQRARASGWSGSTATSPVSDGPEVLSIGRDVTERHDAELQAGRERGQVPRSRRQVRRRRVALRDRAVAALRLHEPVGREHPRIPAVVLPRRLRPSCWRSSTTTGRAAQSRSAPRRADARALRLPLPTRRRLDRRRSRREPLPSAAACRVSAATSPNSASSRRSMAALALAIR